MPPATNQSGRRAPANPAVQSGSDPTGSPVANRTDTASMSSPIRTRVPARASASLGNAAAKDEDSAGGRARCETRGRPCFGRRGGIGKNGSTRFHNGSESSAAAIPLHTTSPKRIRFRKFCYTLARLAHGGDRHRPDRSRRQPRARMRRRRRLADQKARW
jgi:hypothetical protein